MQKLIVVILLSLSFSAFSAEEKIVKLLESSRSEINFKPLSNEDKFVIIRHAKILFSKIYVNLEHKMSLYKVDPINELTKIEQNYQSMDDAQFHSSMLAVFNSVKDYHVNYTFPKPYACYKTALPLAFQKIEAGNKIIVSIVDLSKKDIYPDVLKITAGDELVSYNKKNTTEALRSRSNFINASTPDAMLFQGVYDLYWRGLSENLVPVDNSVQLELKKATGEVYSITVPWFSNVYQSCLNPKVPEETKGLGKKLGNPKEMELRERHKYWKDIRKNFLSFLRSKIKLKNKLIINADAKIEKIDLTNLNATKHPSLFWKAFHYQNENFGYLKLQSFDAEKGVNAAVSEVSSVLRKNLSETSALVIDLRGNYGGQISFAELMATLLTPMPVRPLPFYIRANDLILVLFNEDATWKDLIYPNIETNHLVGPGVLTTQMELTSSSQVYFGKVVLLTNSECFSSCDLFAATMKDNAKVTIYGTDHSTFGGGANVWSIDYLAPVFKALNIPATLPQNVGMRVTGRHAHRQKTNLLIEDLGVATDIFLSENTEDVVAPESSSVVARIFKDLSKTPGLKNSSQISIKFDKDIFQKHGGENLVITSSTSNIDQVAVFKNNKFLKRFKVDSENKLSIDLPLAEANYGVDIFEIYGFNKDTATRTPVLRKSIVVETLAEYKKIEELNPIEDAVFTNFPKSANCGWKKNDNNLVLSGPYCPEMKMEANESIELSQNAHKVSFDLDLDAEPNFDFFEIVVISDGIEEKLMAPTSQPTTGHFEFNLDKYAGKKIDIKFRLTSDEAGSGKGAIVSNLAIK
ncbi:MAG: S41 family peptidase [Bacteriovorax sp.]|nr:S41 family peptidase [Bacteriovorax sp.]